MDATPPYVLITGASSGIGRNLALRLSKQRSLILHGRDQARLEATRELCEGPSARHVIWCCDFQYPEAIPQTLAPLLAPHRHVDALVHCAGMVGPAPVRSLDHRLASEALNVNFVSAVQIVSTLLKKKTNAQRLETVVLVSSIFSQAGVRGHSMYCASKAALDGWMRAAAVELAPGVRVNSILPGAIDTPMSAEGLDDPEISAKLLRDYPLGLGRPDDVAGMVEFLLSPAARWITGQQLVVDGGRSINLSLK